MAYTKHDIEKAKGLVGRSIEIPVHYDLWMRGARFGRVVSLKWRPAFDAESRSYKGREVCGIRVRMEHEGVKRLVVVWMIDLDYVRY